MSKETAASLRSTVDDISQDIGSVNISNNNGTSAAAAACDMSSKREDTISEKKCTSCDQKLEHTNTNGIEVDVSTDDMVVSTCANCGKEGANNTCNKCKLVKYCNAACKKRHRHKHRKACEEHLKRVAKLKEEENKRAVELHDIELFKQPPTIYDDCPICFLRMPNLTSGKRYKSCCGKVICSGCTHAPVYNDQGNAMDNEICPFCRIPTPEKDEEIIQRLQKRMELKDAQAITLVGSYYYEGMFGLPQDYDRAMKLWKQAVELGNAAAYVSIGNWYYFGHGVDRDEKRAVHYFEKGAMGGCTGSRLALGYIEKNSGNMERAIKHFMISVAYGHNGSLKETKQLYSQGHATKDDYVKALRAYQKYLSEVKSTQRDEAAAAREDFKYID